MERLKIATEDLSEARARVVIATWGFEEQFPTLSAHIFCRIYCQHYYCS